MDEKTRIEKLMQHEGMTSGQFAQEIGIQNSTLSHILNNRNNPSLDVMKKILNRFPLINSDWLILGQGPMFRQESHSQMPTLFGFEDEINSLSDTSFEKSVDKSLRSFSANEKKSVDIQSEVNTGASDSKINESLAIKEKSIENSVVSPEFAREQTFNAGKKVIKIILYYSDNTFQEFDSK